MEDFTGNPIKWNELSGNPAIELTLRQSTSNSQALQFFSLILNILEIMPSQTAPHAEY